MQKAKHRTKLLGGVVLAALASQQALATNILSFGTPGRPDSFNWQGFATDTNTSARATSALLNIFSYYTPTGVTGTTRDQFQFSLRGSLGYTGNTNTGIGFQSPGLSGQYYFNIVQPTVADKMDWNFRTWWTNPQITVSLPNGNNQSSGYGSGANQLSVTLQDNNYFALGRFGISVNPISATYLFRDESEVGTAKSTVRRGWNVTLGDTAAGLWVTENLIVGAQAQYNINAVADSTLATSHNARVGPAFTYLGFKQYGFFVAGNYARDVVAQNPSHTAIKGNTFQLWLEKYF